MHSDTHAQIKRTKKQVLDIRQQRMTQKKHHKTASSHWGGGLHADNTEIPQHSSKSRNRIRLTLLADNLFDADKLLNMSLALMRGLGSPEVAAAATLTGASPCRGRDCVLWNRYRRKRRHAYSI